MGLNVSRFENQTPCRLDFEDLNGHPKSWLKGLRPGQTRLVKLSSMFKDEWKNDNKMRVRVLINGEFWGLIIDLFDHVYMYNRTLFTLHTERDGSYMLKVQVSFSTAEDMSRRGIGDIFFRDFIWNKRSFDDKFTKVAHSTWKEEKHDFSDSEGSSKSMAMIKGMKHKISKFEEELKNRKSEPMKLGKEMKNLKMAVIEMEEKFKTTEKDVY